jgi:nuclear transport factor 2 (NTF2) superfamily protein
MLDIAPKGEWEKMSGEENQVVEMKSDFTRFYNAYLYLLETSQYLRTEEALVLKNVISILRSKLLTRWVAEQKRQDVNTVQIGNSKRITITDVYRAEPYSSEYHLVKVTYHVEIDEQGIMKYGLDNIETIEEVNINEVDTPFTFKLQQRLFDELDEMRNPWRTEIEEAIIRLAYAETQGALDDELEELEARLRKELTLENIVFLEAIEQTRKEYSEVDE